MPPLSLRWATRQFAFQARSISPQTFQNIRFNTGNLTNQLEVTDFIAQALQINSTLSERIAGKLYQVRGTYGIYSQLCFRKSTVTVNDTTLHFLMHGAGADRTYWNFAPGYSYIDYAAEQGYTTFTYDRLGVGLSDHPDPIQVLQTEVGVVIAHELIQHLRAGSIGGQAFKHVVGIGHSYGSLQANGITAQYPDDFDAAVLTGFTANPNGQAIAYAALDPSIASENQPSRFANLPAGYLVPASTIANQFFFFRAPAFDPAILDQFEKTKQTHSIGEFLTTPGMVKVAHNFSGPVFVANGENDMPECWGDCLYPRNRAAATRNALYPNANNGSGWYVAPGTGHALALHCTAKEANKRIVDFVRSNGF